MVLKLDDNQAVIAMVDSNLQREHIKPSEKAFAYRMKLEVMKQQGKRTDLTSCQVDKSWGIRQQILQDWKLLYLKFLAGNGFAPGSAASRLFL